MRNNWFALLVLALLQVTGLQAGGGPDAYGYTWLDNTDPGGPVYDWVDISQRPTTVELSGLGDDNAVGPFPLGWDFHYYWNDFDEVTFGSNGWISFAPLSNIASCFPDIPNQGDGDNYLAPMMSDLNFSSSFSNFPNIGKLYYWTNNQDSFVVQWVDVPWWKSTLGQNPPDWIGANTFQLILNGQDSSITYQYKSISSGALTNNPNCNDLVIGIENNTGAIGLEALKEILPANNYAIRFEYPDNVSFQAPDLSPVWNNNPDNQGFLVLTNDTFTLSSLIGNVGNQNINSGISISGEIVERNLQTVLWSSSASLNALAIGQDSLITFTGGASVATPGQYYFRVSLGNPDDINASNDTTLLEVSVVECLSDSVQLTYASGGLPNASISWTSANPDDGLAVYMEPPSYPASLTSVDLFILGDDGDPGTAMTSGFSLVIYDAIGNAPLDSVFVPATAVLEDAWNTIGLSTPLQISSGGVYVAWYMGGEGVGLGTETLGPISRRSYEILSGSWALFRNGSGQDPLIRVNASLPCQVSREQADLRFSQLNVWPNPAQSEVFIALDGLRPGVEGNIQLMDLQGRILRDKSFAPSSAQWEFRLETEGLPRGLYLLTLSQAGKRETRKLILR